MWSDGEDFDSDGKQVRLYQPIPYGRKLPQNDLTSSFIGGETNLTAAPFCTSCQDPLQLLIQLYVPKFTVARKNGSAVNKTLQFFACNRAACYRKLFAQKEDSSDKLYYGDGGVIKCIRVQSTTLDKKENPGITIDTNPSGGWAEDDGTGNDKNGNEWDTPTTSTLNDMDDLASKLAAMESAGPRTKTNGNKKAASKIPASKNTGFPCYELHSVHEPPSVNQKSQGLDDDDVGISGNDDKIQKMLAKYMAEEEDEEILNALRGSSDRNQGGGVKGRGEKDERLSPEDRALLTFTDRLKRSPKQVLRYAYGGIPLWSIPLITPEQYEQRQKQKRNKADSNHQAKKKLYGIESTIPCCDECGAARVFECQLLPSLLHVLQVDKQMDQSGGLNSAYKDGGMDWGNIAIYSCPNVCASETEYCVIQDSVDEQPMAENQLVQGDVVINEDTKFDDDDEDEDDDDDDMEDDGEIDDDDDDW